MNKCIGCGVVLQSTNPLGDGYVESPLHNLCIRCFKIKNYGQNLKIDKSNVDYMAILNNIRDNDLVVYVSSILTLNLEFINNFKNVLLVLTKRDTLPKSVKDSKIIKYVKDRYHNLEDVIIVSAQKKYNLDTIYNKLLKYKKQKIYFVGITNSGKSTLINELIKSYNGALGMVTVSNYPSTTLGIVDTVIGELKVKDTPGIIIENSLINYLNAAGIKKINVKKEIKPITMQVKGTGSILVDNFFRIDYKTLEASFTFYISNQIKVKKISLNNPIMHENNNYGYDVLDNSDLVIEDMGFVKITKATKINIYSSNELYVYVRDKLI